jgi:hypothetical protein
MIGGVGAVGHAVRAAAHPETDNEIFPAFSPDGRWLAYQSNESGTNEVYVRPFPGPGGRGRRQGEGSHRGQPTALTNE